MMGESGTDRPSSLWGRVDYCDLDTVRYPSHSNRRDGIQASITVTWIPATGVLRAAPSLPRPVRGLLRALQLAGERGREDGREGGRGMQEWREGSPGDRRQNLTLR